MLFVGTFGLSRKSDCKQPKRYIIASSSQSCTYEADNKMAAKPIFGVEGLKYQIHNKCNTHVYNRFKIEETLLGNR